MLYLANPCGDRVVDAMRSGQLGLIDSPLQQKPTMVGKAHDAGVPWCADNGAYSSRFNETRWWAFLVANAHRASTCLFAVAPDVVGDASATLARSTPWLPRIRGLGYPVALVAQDGQEDLPVPWDDIDALFIGGSTEWKLGPHAARLAAEAKARGLWVHMGRVNSGKRWRYAHSIGCDSVDGTFLTFAPQTNLDRLLRWHGTDYQPQLDLTG